MIDKTRRYVVGLGALCLISTLLTAWSVGLLGRGSEVLAEQVEVQQDAAGASEFDAQAWLESVSKAKTFELAIGEIGNAEDRERALKAFDEHFLSDFEKVVDNFFPSARSICLNVFTLMNAEQIADAFDKVVDLLDQKAWFYLKNDNKKFSKASLDSLLKEFDIFADFLKTTYVYPETGRIIKKVDQETEQEKNQRSMTLKVYWKRNLRVDTHLRLAAVRLDFLFIKMYSCALRPYPKYQDKNNFQQFKSKIEKVLPELTGSTYERYYKSKLKLALDFAETLSESIASNSNLEPSYGYGV